MKYNHFFVSFLLFIFILFPSTTHPEVSFPVKAKIMVFWRYIPADMNPLDIKIDFTYNGTVTASKSPFGGGGISGKQIVSLIKKKSIDKTIIRYRVLSLKDREDPANRPTLASIVVRDDNSLYDNYVIKTNNGNLALYVDVLVSKLHYKEGIKQP
jgi:hypothetical protein